MDYADEGTVKVVASDQTVEERIKAQKEERRLGAEAAQFEIENATRPGAVYMGLSEIEVIPSNLSHTERRAQILNEATDLIEQAYDNLRAAIDTMTICDINAQEKYAGVVREMGKTVRDFSGKL